MGALRQNYGQRQKQNQGLRQMQSPAMQLCSELLTMSLPQLRQRVLNEMSQNPVVDYVESTLDDTLLSQKEHEAEAENSTPDYLDDDYDQSGEYSQSTNVDTEAMERRERMFERQVKEETLPEHLLNQLPLSDIDEKDIPLAEILIDELDACGYFRGSMADVVMTSGETEPHIRKLLGKISQLDPLGCGATTHQECLLAQLSEIEDPIVRLHVKALIERHWEDMAEGNVEKIMRSLKIDRAEYDEAHRALVSLDPMPGRQFRKSLRDVEIVNPEVHLERCSDGWMAKVDARSLPEIHISAKYLRMAQDTNLSQEARDYINQRVEAVKMLIEAIKHRQETIEKIAQAVFDAQPAFFDKGLKGLKPLTEEQVAKTTGVSIATVSRTVNDKYASTPQGIVQLRRLFVGGFTNESGEQYTRTDVEGKLREIIDGENKAKPLSDDAICQKLKDLGFPVARRTIAKYRDKLGIEPASRRKK